MEENHKIYKRKFNDAECMKEMANLRNNKTGLSHGTIYISTKEGNHGPRIKFYRDSPGVNKSASINISKNPEVVEDSIHITGQEQKEVFEFVKLNYNKLIDFWNNGNSWYSDEVDSFIKSLEKIQRN